jgi:hypothetical protein
MGRTTDTHVHLLMRFAVTFLGIHSILLLNLFPRWPLPGVIALHYAVAMAAVLALVWASSCVVELHPHAYRDIVINFTGFYVLVAAIFCRLTRCWKRTSARAGGGP